MPRRRFRFDPELGQMVELLDVAPSGTAHMIECDMSKPFMHNGVFIDSKAKLREHMARNNLVPYHVPDRSPSGAEQQRDRQALREFIWEGVSRTFSMGRKPRDR